MGEDERTKRMKVAITGHRPNKLNDEYDLDGPCTEYLKSELQKIIDDWEPAKLISGLALGVDTIWALLAVKNNLPLIAAVPFAGQEKRWPKPSQERYQKILRYSQAEKVIVSEGAYAPWKMQVRNKYMVNECDKLVAVWDRTGGGTYNCVKYAQQNNKGPHFIIDPNGWK